MIDHLLKTRNLPPLRHRNEMLTLLLEEEYGYLPPKPETLSWTVEGHPNDDFFGGKATLYRIILHSKMQNGTFSFPLCCVIPNGGGPCPFFIHINFDSAVPSKYMPSEELIDAGFAVVSFYYEDVTKDENEFQSGLAGILYRGCCRGPQDPGKLAMWAWAAQRAMDYCESLPQLNQKRAVVCGHSRLGKAAMLASATDHRFTFTYANESGCSGAAITRGKAGEQIQNIYSNFPYWFCPNYEQYVGREAMMPFDQHYLAALIAPRFLLIGSAQEDRWSDPDSEFLCCAAVSQAYEVLGVPGFMGPDRLPQPGELFLEGNVGYHLRKGSHFFSREDWNRLISFIRLHAERNEK